MAEKYKKGVRSVQKAVAWALVLCMLAGCGKKGEPQETLKETASSSGALEINRPDAEGADQEGNSPVTEGNDLEGNRPVLGDVDQEGSSPAIEGADQEGSSAAFEGAEKGGSSQDIEGADQKGNSPVLGENVQDKNDPASAGTNGTGDASAQAPSAAGPDSADDSWAEESGLQDFQILGDTLFDYYGTAQHVVVPDGVKVIWEKAFYNNTSITSVVLPQGVTAIGDAAFNGCRQLEEIIIPESLKTIGSKAFSGCNALKNIDLQHVRGIGAYAFYKCNALTTAVLTDLENIGNLAFFHSALETVSGMEHLEEIGGSVFRETPFFYSYTEVYETELFIRNHILIFARDCEKELAIPQGVQVIAQGAFDGESVSTLFLPQSIMEIGAEAFEGGYLETVYMPQKDIKLGRNALGRYNLHYIVILPLPEEEAGEPNPDFLIAGNVLLAYRGKDADIVIPDGVKEIGEEVFADMAIESVRLPEGLTTVRAEAFRGCSRLETILVPASLSFIGAEAFWGCSALNAVDLQFVQIIDEDAFRGCGSLETVNLSSVKTIGQQAFLFSGVKQVDGMEQLSDLGDGVFDQTPLLAAESGGMKIIGKVLLDGRKCEGSIVIPNGVEIIANNAFEGAGITSVSCPDTLRTIGTKAFYCCPVLKEFVMGDSVVSLGGYVFGEDAALSDVRLSKRLEQIPDTAFLGCESLRMLTIPQGCIVESLCFDIYGSFFQEDRRLLTVPPTAEVPGFLRDSGSGEHKIYTTQIPNSDWVNASQKYGWSLSLLELAAGELTLREGEEYLLIFNSGAKADWYSINEAVVSVDPNGRLCAVGAGETDVVAQIYGKEYWCHVSVR